MLVIGIIIEILMNRSDNLNDSLLTNLTEDLHFILTVWCAEGKIMIGFSIWKSKFPNRTNYCIPNMVRYFNYILANSLPSNVNAYHKNKSFWSRFHFIQKRTNYINTKPYVFRHWSYNDRCTLIDCYVKNLINEHFWNKSTINKVQCNRTTEIHERHIACEMRANFMSSENHLKSLLLIYQSQWNKHEQLYDQNVAILLIEAILTATQTGRTPVIN